MNCKNCGSPLKDDETFCKNCGTEIEVQQQSPTDDITSDSKANSPEPKQKKDNSRKIIVGFFVIVLLCIIGFSLFGKYPILYTFSPKAYSATVLNNTFMQLNDEYAQQQKSLPKFYNKNLKEYTVSIDGGINDGDSKKASLKLGVSKKTPELIGEFKQLQNDEVKTSSSFFWNDNSIGANLSPILNDYFTIPTDISKDTWNNSTLRKDLNLDSINEDIHAPFSDFSDGLNTISGKTNNQLFNASKSFAKKLKYQSKENTEITLNNETVTAKKVVFSCNNAEFKNYINALIKTLKKDQNLSDNCKSVIGNLEENFNNNTEFSDNFTVSIFSYKKNAVGFNISSPITINNTKFTLNADLMYGNTDVLTNNKDIRLSLSSADETLSMNITSVGDHIPKDNVYSDNSRIVLTIPKTSPITITSEYKYDSSNSELSGRAKFSNDKSNQLISYSGTLKDDNGFELDLPSITLTDNNASTTTKGSLSFSIEEGVNIEKPDTSSQRTILDMSESDLSNLLLSVALAK